MIQAEEIKNSLSTARSRYYDRQKQQEESKQLSEYKDAQSLIEIENIIDGLIFTSDGRIVSILEILPINYSEKSDTVKDSIGTSFGFSFKQLPDDGQFKVMYINTNLDKFEETVRSHTTYENNPRLKERVDDYIDHIRRMQQENLVCRRFFYIYEYTGDENGRFSDDYDSIYQTMMQNQRDAFVAFSEMGNSVINVAEDSKDVADIFYQYYNPRSAQSESFSKRIDKVSESAQFFNQEATVKDFVAPRGIHFGKWDYVAFDGMCHTYLALKDTSYPTMTTVGWLNEIIGAVDNGDVDIFYHKANSSMNSFLIDRVDVVSRGISYRHNDSEIEKQEELATKADNAKYLKDRLKEGEDFYEVCVIVTLRADTVKELHIKLASFIKKMKSSDYTFDKCTLNTMAYFKMTAPLHHVENSIFRSHRRNMTNSALSTLYCFSSFEMFDRNGYCLGYKVMKNNNTLFAVDNFNKIYPNPHIFIAGTSGAGKSFTEMCITSRMRMNGIRTMYILPLKGHEYADMVHSLGGTYLKIAPGSANCINICEIRPSDKINLSSLKNDSELLDELKNIPSFLSQKITLLINWVRMLLDESEHLSRDEAGELNIAFTRVYERFGITDDNSSVFNADGSIKTMPIIEDLYNEIKDDALLRRVTSAMKPWVFGNCKNMNGQTNIDLSNMTIAFDVNEDTIGEELLPAFMLICFDICYGIAQRDLNEKCCIVLDETWKFLMIPECAKYIFKMIKILRAYKTCMITATQDIEDCMNFEYGRVLLTLSATKIYQRMDKNELNALSTSVTFSERNMMQIQKLPSGYGFYCANDDRVLVKFDLSDLELELYEPDKEKKAKAHAKRMERLKAHN